MNTLPVLRIALLVLPAVLLGACRSGRPASCAKPGIYTEAQSVPPLRIPAGLEAPDTRGSMRIPALNEPEQPLPKVAPCIDAPPKYSNNARLEPTTPAKKSRWWRRDRTPAAPPAAPSSAAPPPAAPGTGAATP